MDTDRRDRKTDTLPLVINNESAWFSLSSVSATVSERDSATTFALNSVSRILVAARPRPLR